MASIEKPSNIEAQCSPEDKFNVLGPQNEINQKIWKEQEVTVPAIKTYYELYLPRAVNSLVYARVLL